MKKVAIFYIKMKEMWNISTISSGDIPKLRNGLVGINGSKNFSDFLQKREGKRKKIDGAGFFRKIPVLLKFGENGPKWPKN